MDSAADSMSDFGHAPEGIEALKTEITSVSYFYSNDVRALPLPSSKHHQISNNDLLLPKILAL